jgi:hypothetical protein
MGPWARFGVVLTTSFAASWPMSELIARIGPLRPLLGCIPIFSDQQVHLIVTELLGVTEMILCKKTEVEYAAVSIQSVDATEITIPLLSAHW